jgi:hypothetical protein
MERHLNSHGRSHPHRYGLIFRQFGKVQALRLQDLSPALIHHLESAFGNTQHDAQLYCSPWIDILPARLSASCRCCCAGYSSRARDLKFRFSNFKPRRE